MNKNFSKKQVLNEILYTSLIGKNIEIVDSSNKTLIGLKGVIVYETLSLFHINVDGKIKKVLKSAIKFIVELSSGKFLVDCKMLEGDLVSRIKKLK